jgi:hypothetical protein
MLCILVTLLADSPCQVFRTVYTEESDAMLPIAMEKLNLWMTRYYLHLNRFDFRAKTEEAKQKLDATVNEELARRFRLQLVQDQVKLNMPNLKSAKHDDIRYLCDYFHQWVASVGEDPQCEYPKSPRIVDFLAIDEESMHFLAALPYEILPLRVAVDLPEKLVSVNPVFTTINDLARWCIKSDHCCIVVE